MTGMRVEWWFFWSKANVLDFYQTYSVLIYVISNTSCHSMLIYVISNTSCPSIILGSFLCQHIILVSFHHSEVIPMPFTHSVVIQTFQTHSDVIPSFWCYSIHFESFHCHSNHCTVILSFPHHLASFQHHSVSPPCSCPNLRTFFLQPAVRLG